MSFSQIITHITRVTFLSMMAVVLSACVNATEKAYGELKVIENTDNWRLIWSDEFDKVDLDETKWTHEIDCWGGGNEEQQCYTNSQENTYIKGGVLHIVALKQNVSGPSLPPHMIETGSDTETVTKPFSSARLNTKGKAEWTYGRFEVRAKMPKGQGMWPAIWMLPSENHYGTWAISGEIDIVEAVNQGTKCKTCEGGKENRILGTIHYGDVWPRNQHKGEEHVPDPSSADAFHTYAIEWSEGEISWFVDDVKFSTLTSSDWASDALTAKGVTSSAPFDRPFHFVLNLAVGGHLAESENETGIDMTDFPKSMQIDWVRVYKPVGN